MQPSAYGVYLLHYIFIVWLQYAVYDLPDLRWREVRGGFYRHTLDELDPHHCTTEYPVRGADDLRYPRQPFELKRMNAG